MDYFMMLVKFVICTLTTFNTSTAINAVFTLMAIGLLGILHRSGFSKRHIRFSSEKEKHRKIVKIDTVAYIVLALTVVISLALRGMASKEG